MIGRIRRARAVPRCAIAFVVTAGLAGTAGSATASVDGRAAAGGSTTVDDARPPARRAVAPDEPAALLVASAAPVAWGLSAHRVVCEIAWREMTPGARAEARRLTDALGWYGTFAESCVWADDPDAKRIYNSHWMNMPRRAESVSMRDCPADCVLRHLAGERDRLGDTARDLPTRARALMFVGHFVGDLHNPAHVAFGDDRGGNQHAIRGLGERIDDLHAVWDTYLTAAGTRDWRRYAAELHESIDPEDRLSWRSSEPIHWANESFGIARTRLYQGLGGPEGSRVPRAYLTRNRPIAERQMKKAGVRLGALLNTVLDGP